MRVSRSSLFWPSMSAMFASSAVMGVAWHTTVIRGEPSALRDVLLSTAVALASATVVLYSFPSWESTEREKEAARAVRLRRLQETGASDVSR